MYNYDVQAAMPADELCETEDLNLNHLVFAHEMRHASLDCILD